jgi:hypothetical protein
VGVLPALCLAAGALSTSLPTGQFTLRWQHSIEKVDWAEDYEIAGDWLHLSQARIRGSGAGMEPPDGAVLVDGIYRYRLADPWRRELVLARSPYVRDYELCVDGRCRPLTDWLPLETTTLRACAR